MYLNLKHHIKCHVTKMDFHILFKKISFIIYACVCVQVHVSTGAHRRQNQTSWSWNCRWL